MRRAALILFAALVSLPATAQAAPCPAELPVLFIVQDKSGSMAKQPDGSAALAGINQKWDMAKAAIGQLTSTFDNRFRFGLNLYPELNATFSCSLGKTVAPVGSTSSKIASELNKFSVPSGGTPTADTLDQVRQYLLPFRTQTPVHVLLITDGLPNCNLGANTQTCTASTPGCNAQTDNCGLGPKDCLDDARTRAAAAALKSAGIKVYVVGFGADATNPANLAVLNGVASSGGTNQAYRADDQASLHNALNQIAFDATSCCRDVCTLGAASCTAAGEVRKCELDASIGCTNWTLTTCAPKTGCSAGACVPTCTDACTLGALRCSGGDAQQCVTGSKGCSEWAVVDDCGYGEKCSAGTCESCTGCTPGATRCYGKQVETCTLDILTGCSSFKRSACQTGSVCSGGTCTACNTTCTVGAKRCNGAFPETCIADDNGCTSWARGAQCEDFCSGGECGTCGTTCTAGAKRCNGSTPETCGYDQNGCTVWDAGSECGSNTFCDSGTCKSCPTDCTPGERRCAGNGIQECQVTTTGCRDWVDVATCLEGESCKAGVCIPPCQDECSAGAQRCDGTGVPEACEVVETGCTVWKAKAACGGTELCVQGICHEKCSPGEIATCRPGYVCTTVEEGKICLPAQPNHSQAPALDIEEPVDENKPLDVTQPLEDEFMADTGCGCSSAARGSALWFALLPLAFGLRRRRV